MRYERDGVASIGVRLPEQGTLSKCFDEFVGNCGIALVGFRFSSKIAFSQAASVVIVRGFLNQSGFLLEHTALGRSIQFFTDVALSCIDLGHRLIGAGRSPMFASAGIPIDHGTFRLMNRRDATTPVRKLMAVFPTTVLADRPCASRERFPAASTRIH